MDIKKKSRSETGALGSVILCMVIIVVISLCALAIDIAHFVTVKHQLQAATDAAALSGARQIRKNRENAVNTALFVASLNKADGRFVSNSSNGIMVNAQLVSLESGKEEVQVEAEAVIRNMFAIIFGNALSRVGSRSHAGAAAPATTLFADVAFPIGVSADARGGLSALPDPPLASKSIGSTFTLYIGKAPVDPILPDGNPVMQSNASMTTFFNAPTDSNYIYHAINQELKLEPVQPGYRPSLVAGDSIALATEYGVSLHVPNNLSLLKNKVLILPVFTGDIKPGEKRTIIGFMALKVLTVMTTVETGAMQIMTGTIVAATVPGVSGTNSYDSTSVWSQMAPKTVRLTY